MIALIYVQVKIAEMGQRIFPVFGDGHQIDAGNAEFLSGLHHLFVLAGYGNQEGAEHAHIQGFDIGNHSKAAGEADDE